MKITIRKAKISEIDRVKAITKQAYHNPFDIRDKVTSWPKETRGLNRSVRNKEINILVAVIDKKIIGAVRYDFPDDKTAHLFRLVVLKRYRGRGIARELAYSVEKIAKEAGTKKVELDFMVEKNLRPFYENLGYQVTKIIKHGNHHDAFVQKKLV